MVIGIYLGGDNMILSNFLNHGEQGEFQYFTLPHFIPVLLMLLAIFLLYKYGDKLKD